MPSVLESARETIQAINANLSASPAPGGPTTKFGRFNKDTGDVEWSERSRIVQHHTAYPFYSMNLKVARDDVDAAQAMLRSHGVIGVEFDERGCPKIESDRQYRRIAQAMGLFNGRDGYGHKTEDGRHEHSGERRGLEMQAASDRRERLMGELAQMPDEVSPTVMEGVVEKHFG